MLKYLELCVDLRKSHLAKEGLYQYKNICQQVCEEKWGDVAQIGRFLLFYRDGLMSFFAFR